VWELEKVDEEELKQTLEKICSIKGVEIEIKDEEVPSMYEGEEEEDSFYRRWEEEEDEEGDYSDVEEWLDSLPDGKMEYVTGMDRDCWPSYSVS
jgi:hypothetical protein